MGDIVTITSDDGPGGEGDKLPHSEDSLTLSSVSSAPFTPPSPRPTPLLQWRITSLEVKARGKSSRRRNDGGGGGDAKQGPEDEAGGGSLWSRSIHHQHHDKARSMTTTSSSRRSRTKTILKDIKGQASRGQMVVVMGSSGAGKSCLLDCLSLRNHSFKGDVYFEGKLVNERYYSATAYVHSTDLFFATLTVREHLTFHGMVRVPGHVPVDERMQRVDAVLNAVDMVKVADSLIGGPETLIRGISGGERKRLSVATELLSDPDIIFADEPTSGLDAFMALSVTRILRQQAVEGGRVVMAVVHQPSSEIFELFSHLLLLTKGRLAYYGPRVEASRFFSSMGHHCPTFYNPADFYIETLSLDSNNNHHHGQQEKQRQHEEAIKRVDAIVMAYADSSYAQSTDRALSTLPARPHFSLLQHGGGDFFSSKAYPATLTTQFVETYKRTVKSYRREPVLFRVRLVQAVSLGLILGFVYFRKHLSEGSAIKNRIGAMFLVIMNQTIASQFTVSQAIPRELPVFMREYLTSANRPSAYSLAVMLAELPYQVIFPCIFGTLVYWLMGLASDVDRYLTFILILVLVANAGCAMGYAVSSLTGHDAIAFALGPILVLPMSLYAGILHSPRDIPFYFVPLDAISMIHPAFRAMVINEYSSPTYSPALRHAIYDFLSINPSFLWRDVGILAVLIVGFRLAAYFFLLMRARAALQ